MELIIERFDSLARYLDIIGKRPNNAAFGSERSSETGDYEFTLTHNYDEAVNLALNGYKEGLDGMMAAGARVQHRENTSRAMPTVDVVGYAPHVANAISGIPRSMITKTAVPQTAKVLTILYAFGAHSGTEAQRFITAGKNLLNVITTLETQGYRVGLNVMNPTVSRREGQWLFNIVQVKHWRQPSNPLKLAYPLAHPSFFRRNAFKWRETCPEITDASLRCGYGLSFIHKIEGENNQRKWLREHGILPPGVFYTSFEEAEQNEADALIKRMGIK